MYLLIRIRIEMLFNILMGEIDGALGKDAWCKWKNCDHNMDPRMLWEELIRIHRGINR